MLNRGGDVDLGLLAGHISVHVDKRENLLNLKSANTSFPNTLHG
jgi:hypothetical protein